MYTLQHQLYINSNMWTFPVSQHNILFFFFWKKKQIRFKTTLTWSIPLVTKMFSYVQESISVILW